MPTNIIEDFIGFSELVEELSNINGSTQGIHLDESIRMKIKSVKMELPVELDLAVNDKEEVEIGGTPPIYYLETSFMPVFHQMKITLLPIKELDNGK